MLSDDLNVEHLYKIIMFLIVYELILMCLFCRVHKIIFNLVIDRLNRQTPPYDVRIMY